MKFRFRGCWGPRPVWDDVPRYAGEILSYITHLSALDAPCGSIRVPDSAGWSEGDPPSERLVAKLRADALTSAFDTQGTKQPYRSVLVSAGTNGANTDLDGDKALFRDGELATSLMLDLARFWNAHDAWIATGQTVEGRYKTLYWKRWSRPDSPVAALQPIPPGYASAELLDGGTLYTWPEWEPSRHVDQRTTVPMDALTPGPVSRSGPE